MTPKNNYATTQKSLDELMNYIRRSDPAFYQYLMSYLADDENNNLGQIEAESDSPTMMVKDQSSILDKILNAATSFYQAKQQRDILKLQVKRAEQGLSPINVDELKTPPVRVEVSTPNLLDQIKPALPWVAGGLLLLKFLPSRGR